ncbi:MAG: hypothetical protein Q8R04_02490 [Nanoarchaeota archaeon]|nr:hypothetical protein [Nanoarchaeota archaeon]
MNRRNLYTGLLLLGAVAGATGCATSKDVSRLEQEVGALRESTAAVQRKAAEYDKTKGDLTGRVEKLETSYSAVMQRTLSESAILIPKSVFPEQYGTIFGLMSAQYQDSKVRETAQAEATHMYVVGKVGVDKVNVSPVTVRMVDGRPTVVKYLAPGGKDAVEVPRTTLPTDVQNWLLDVRVAPKK